MKTYDRRVSTRSAEGSSEVRSRRQLGTESGTQGEQLSDVNEDRAYNQNLEVQKLRAKRLEERKKNAKTPEERASVESDMFDFEEGTGMTTREALSTPLRNIPGTQENKTPRKEQRKLGIKPKDEEA